MQNTEIKEKPKTTKKVIGLRSVALDGGYGWFVVLGSFLIHVLIDGFVYSFGLLEKSIEDKFNLKEKETSIVISLLTGFMLIIGPVASAVCNRIGCRLTTVLGGAISLVGSLLACFSTLIFHLYISVGVLMGIGFGFLYCPAIIIVTMYFERYRSLATGITVCGAAVGSLTMPFIFPSENNNYDLKDIFSYYSGAMIICILCGLLYKPLKFEPIYEDEVSLEKNVDIDILVDKEPKKDNVLEQNEFFDDFTKKNYLNSQFNRSITRSEQNDLSNLQNLSLIKNEKTTNVLQKFRSLGEHLNCTGLNFHNNNMSNSEKRRVISISIGYLNVKDVFYNRSLTALPQYSNKQQRFRSIFPLNLSQNQKILNLTTNSKTEKKNVEEIEEECLIKSLKLSEKNLEILTNNESITKISSSTKDSRAIEIWRTIKRLINLSLFTDIIYLLFAISNFLTSISFNTVPFIIPTFAKDIIKIENNKYCIVFYGWGNLIGRIFFGYICDKKLPSKYGKDVARNRLWVYNWTLMLIGLLTCFVFLIEKQFIFFIYCFVFGFLISSYVCLTSVVLVDLIGVDKLSNGFGLLLSVQGVATFIGPPLTALIKKLTDTYNWSFVFCGICFFLSGFMLLSIEPISNWKRKRKLNKNKESKIQICKK